MTIQVYQSEETGYFYLKIGQWLGGIILRPLINRGGSLKFEVSWDDLEQRFQKVAEHEFSA